LRCVGGNQVWDVMKRGWLRFWVGEHKHNEWKSLKHTRQFTVRACINASNQHSVENWRSAAQLLLPHNHWSLTSFSPPSFFWVYLFCRILSL
jgi:hypothetical protein